MENAKKKNRASAARDPLERWLISSHLHDPRQLMASLYGRWPTRLHDRVASNSSDQSGQPADSPLDRLAGKAPTTGHLSPFRAILAIAFQSDGLKGVSEVGPLAEEQDDLALLLGLLGVVMEGGGTTPLSVGTGLVTQVP